MIKMGSKVNTLSHKGESVIINYTDLKNSKEDYRTLKLYGQEKNLTSSSIAFRFVQG